MDDVPVIHPLGLAVLRSFLLARPEITTHTSWVAAEMPSPFQVPSIRLTELSSVEAVPRVWMRMHFQAECWGETQVRADRLGRHVISVLRAGANTVISGAVLGEVADLVVRAQPDESLTPVQPRAIVTGHAWIRPS